MGIFGSQASAVVEWKEYSDDIIFWKYSSSEIKKGSKLIIRPGQDAIFMYNGRIEGIFKDEGSFDIESEIIPFLTTLKSFTFGFNTPMRAEILFVNTREFTVKWGTRNAIILQAEGLPGGIPVRAYGTFNFKVSDYTALIDKVAGVRNKYTVEDVRERVSTVLNALLMKWIATEGKNIFNLQANAYAIGKGIQGDLDYEMTKDGITITGFSIQSVSFPEEIAKMHKNR
jgi:membrane protease subunit (stomatin/prohibitin family)